MTDAPRPSDDELAAALEQHAGNVSAVANMFGCPRTTISSRINRTESLKQIASDFREEAIDGAVTALNKAAKGGQPWAVCFLLKTQGKDRGYIEKADVVAIRAVFAFVSDAMKAAKELELPAHSRATFAARIQKAAAKRFPEVAAPS